MLIAIDELSREDHYYLTTEDECYYLREYTAHEGYSASDANQFVFNLKCPIYPYNQKRLFYKNRDIRIASSEICRAVKGTPLALATYIPIPPAKKPGHPQYDSRVRAMLSESELLNGIKVCDALENVEDREPAHLSGNKRDVDSAMANLRFISSDWMSANLIVIFDDLLVTGCQYRAVERMIHKQLPTVPVIGLFCVRRTFPS